MWIRILGILYNLNHIQAIEYNAKDRELYFHYGACGTVNRGSVVSDTTTINFKRPGYGNEYGLAIYAQLIDKLTIIKTVDNDLKPITETDFNQNKGEFTNCEGINPNAEFVTTATEDLA